jgi:hypothetical protein
MSIGYLVITSLTKGRLAYTKRQWCTTILECHIPESDRCYVLEDGVHEAAMNVLKELADSVEKCTS